MPWLISTIRSVHSWTVKLLEPDLPANGADAEFFPLEIVDAGRNRARGLLYRGVAEEVSASESACEFAESVREDLDFSSSER